MELRGKVSEASTDCKQHRRLLGGVLARLFMDIRNEWYLDSAEVFLKSDWCTYIWDSLDFLPDDRERLKNEVAKRIYSKNVWFWSAYRRVMKQLPEDVEAHLKELRIEFQFLSPDEFVRRFEEVDTMRVESTGRGLELIGHTIVINKDAPEMAKARAGDNWEAAIDASLAHEFAHIHLEHFWVDLICDASNTNQDEKRIIIEHQNFAADLQARLWGFDVDAMGVLPKRRKSFGDVV